MSKKTMPVAQLLYVANTFLAAKNTTKEGRRAMDGMIATILHETGNYCGFSVNESPEIAPSSDDAPVRHRYFVSGKLSDDYDAIAAASTY